MRYGRRVDMDRPRTPNHSPQVEDTLMFPQHLQQSLPTLELPENLSPEHLAQLVVNVLRLKISFCRSRKSRNILIKAQQILCTEDDYLWSTLNHRSGICQTEFFCGTYEEFCDQLLPKRVGTATVRCQTVESGIIRQPATTTDVEIQTLEKQIISRAVQTDSSDVISTGVQTSPQTMTNNVPSVIKVSHEGPKKRSPEQDPDSTAQFHVAQVPPPTKKRKNSLDKVILKRKRSNSFEDEQKRCDMYLRGPKKLDRQSKESVTSIPLETMDPDCVLTDPRLLSNEQRETIRRTRAKSLAKKLGLEWEKTQNSASKVRTRRYSCTDISNDSSGGPRTPPSPEDTDEITDIADLEFDEQKEENEPPLPVESEIATEPDPPEVLRTGDVSRDEELINGEIPDVSAKSPEEEPTQAELEKAKTSQPQASEAPMTFQVSEDKISGSVESSESHEEEETVKEKAVAMESQPNKSQIPAPLLKNIIQSIAAVIHTKMAEALETREKESRPAEAESATKEVVEESEKRDVQLLKNADTVDPETNSCGNDSELLEVVETESEPLNFISDIVEFPEPANSVESRLDVGLNETDLEDTKSDDCTEIVCAELVCTETICAVTVCTEPVCTEPVCTEPVCTEPVCTEPVCTEPVCTEPVCTEPVCTEPVCTEPICTITLESKTSEIQEPLDAKDAEKRDVSETDTNVPSSPEEKSVTYKETDEKGDSENVTIQECLVEERTDIDVGVMSSSVSEESTGKDDLVKDEDEVINQKTKDDDEVINEKTKDEEEVINEKITESTNEKTVEVRSIDDNNEVSTEIGGSTESELVAEIDSIEKDKSVDLAMEPANEVAHSESEQPTAADDEIERDCSNLIDSSDSDNKVTIDDTTLDDVKEDENALQKPSEPDIEKLGDDYHSLSEREKAEQVCAEPVEDARECDKEFFADVSHEDLDLENDSVHDDRRESTNELDLNMNNENAHKPTKEQNPPLPPPMPNEPPPIPSEPPPPPPSPPATPKPNYIPMVDAEEIPLPDDPEPITSTVITIEKPPMIVTTASQSFMDSVPTGVIQHQQSFPWHSYQPEVSYSVAHQPNASVITQSCMYANDGPPSTHVHQANQIQAPAHLQPGAQVQHNHIHNTAQTYLCSSFQPGAYTQLGKTPNYVSVVTPQSNFSHQIQEAHNNAAGATMDHQAYQQMHHHQLQNNDLNSPEMMAQLHLAQTQAHHQSPESLTPYPPQAPSAHQNYAPRATLYPPYSSHQNQPPTPPYHSSRSYSQIYNFLHQPQYVSSRESYGQYPYYQTAPYPTHPQNLSTRKSYGHQGGSYGGSLHHQPFQQTNQSRGSKNQSQHMNIPSAQQHMSARSSEEQTTNYTIEAPPIYNVSTGPQQTQHVGDGKYYIEQSGVLTKVSALETNSYGQDKPKKNRKRRKYVFPSFAKLQAGLNGNSGYGDMHLC